MYQPQPGDIGLVPGGGIIMRIVRWATRAPYGHAFVYIGHGRIVEAQPTGAVARFLHYENAYWCSELSADLTDAQRSQIGAWALGHVGTPYSWIDDAEIGLVDVFGWAPWWMRRRLASERTLMCSQLCDAAYAAAGVQLFADGRPAGGVAPGDLWRLNEARVKAKVSPCA